MSSQKMITMNDIIALSTIPIEFLQYVSMAPEFKFFGLMAALSSYTTLDFDKIL